VKECVKGYILRCILGSGGLQVARGEEEGGRGTSAAIGRGGGRGISGIGVGIGISIGG